MEQLRKVITNEEASKLIKILLQQLADYLSPESEKKKYLNYYRVLNFWSNQISKSALTSIMNEIFSGCSFRLDSESSKLTLHLRALLHWISTQVLGNSFEKADIEPIIVYVVRGLRGIDILKSDCEQLIKMCYQIFGDKEAQMWLEKLLIGSQNVYKIYAAWHDANFMAAAESKAGNAGRLGDLSAIDPKNLSFDSRNNSMAGTPKETPEKQLKTHDGCTSKAQDEAAVPASNKKLRSSLMKEALIGQSHEASPEAQAPPAEAEVQGEEPLKIESLEKEPKASSAFEATSPRFGSQAIAKQNSKKDSAIKIEGVITESLLFKQEKDKIKSIVESCLRGEKNEKSIAQLQMMLVNKESAKAKAKEGVKITVQGFVSVYKDLLIDADGSSNKKKVSFPEKLILIKLFNDILSNEDILQSAPIFVMAPLCAFCLQYCAIEKIAMTQGKPCALKDIICANNDIISELQNCLTKIVNSHSFTLVLGMLIDLLKENLPEDFAVELKQTEIVLLRLILICMQRTYKAAMTSDDTKSVCGSQTLGTGTLNIRTYAVLIQLYQLFIQHPPEKLKLTLPSLPVFDLVYKILRELTDDLISRDMDKAIAFLKWADNVSEVKETFIKYVGTVVARVAKEEGGKEEAN